MVFAIHVQHFLQTDAVNQMTMQAGRASDSPNSSAAEILLLYFHQGVCLVLLALTFVLIYLDAKDIFHLFG